MPAKIGPNVKRLISLRMAQLAIPDGTPNPVAAGARTFLEPGRLAALAKEATEWVQGTLLAIRIAPDNPFGNDDEAIAAELVRRIEKRKCAPRRDQEDA